MINEQKVLDALKVIMDPDLGKDIVSLGFVKDLKIGEDGRVAFALELTTPACPVKDRFKQQAEQAVGALDGVTAVEVTLTARQGRSGLEPLSQGLEKVRIILAVSSCKGGVGKSTTAVNLACALSASGAKVGIFDADVYGPSLPTLVRPDNSDLFQDPATGLIEPLSWEGIRLMSFGFIPKQSGSEAAIMRGPMVTQVINQLLTGTHWGELDYLVLDLPPGTGDIQLTLTQVIPITAAVIVTTPQQLSFMDVVKGIEMFDKLKVPVAAVVENMSWFEPEPGGERYYLFGRGAREKLVRQYGIQHAVEIPIVPLLAETSDAGTPLVAADPDHPLSAVYRELADGLVREISTIQHGGREKPRFSYHPDRGILMRTDEGAETAIDPVELRARCRCARCVDEMTGEQILRREDIPAEVFPKSLKPMGNYALAVDWHPDHASIYPYEVFQEWAGKG